jgi:hypothetical protein
MDPELSEPTCKGVGNDRQAIQLTIVEPLKQFVHLQRFPIELQAKIWKFAIPLTILARIVSIIPKVKGNQLPSALFHLCFVARSEYRKHYERIVSKDLSFAFFFNYELDTLDINRKHTQILFINCIYISWYHLLFSHLLSAHP